LLLRASGAVTGRRFDAAAVTSDAAAATSGVAHAATLLAFADAVVGSDDEALARARTAVLHELGSAALVDAAAVASNFERMVRVADATGIPLDPPLVILTETLREELGANRFGAAINTPPPSAALRLAGRVLRPIAFPLLRLAQRLRRPR
jgi:hypothetical protein